MLASQPAPRPLPAAVLASLQFSSSKWLPGGEAGASALAEALDLQGALMCRHLDWASLRDPRRQPQLAEQAAPKVRTDVVTSSFLFR